MRQLVIVSALVFAASPAFAQFEGVIEMKITGGDGQAAMSGTTVMHLGKPGMRMQMTMKLPGDRSMTMESLMKFSEPNVMYQLDAAEKTYRTMDLKGGEGFKKGQDHTWTVKRLGQESIAGFKCEHLLVSNEKAEEFELWTSKDVTGADKWQRMLSQRGGAGDGSEGMMIALKKQNLDGFIAKLVANAKSGSPYTMELVKAKKEAVPASMFEVPDGYTKDDAKGPKLPPEARKQMEEAMKHMTPEQREAIKKQMSGGQH